MIWRCDSRRSRSAWPLASYPAELRESICRLVTRPSASPLLTRAAESCPRTRCTFHALERSARSTSTRRLTAGGAGAASSRRRSPSSMWLSSRPLPGRRSGRHFRATTTRRVGHPSTAAQTEGGTGVSSRAPWRSHRASRRRGTDGRSVAAAYSSRRATAAGRGGRSAETPVRPRRRAGGISPARAPVAAGCSVGTIHKASLASGHCTRRGMAGGAGSSALRAGRRCRRSGAGSTPHSRSGTSRFSRAAAAGSGATRLTHRSSPSTAGGHGGERRAGGRSPRWSGGLRPPTRLRSRWPTRSRSSCSRERATAAGRGASSTAGRSERGANSPPWRTPSGRPKPAFPAGRLSVELRRRRAPWLRSRSLRRVPTSSGATSGTRSLRTSAPTVAAEGRHGAKRRWAQLTQTTPEEVE